MEKEATVLSELFPDAAAHIEAKREDTRMAVATLLQFSKDEEKLLRDHLEWKTSWFGNLTTTKPDLGQGQFSLSMNP